jgi:hypothetical protein
MGALAPEPEPNDGKDKRVKAGKKAETGKLAPYRANVKKKPGAAGKKTTKKRGK